MSDQGQVLATVDPDELAVLFWSASGIPLEYLAKATGASPEALSACKAKLRDKLPDLAEGDTGQKIDFDLGWPPSNARPWAERTMTRAVHECLTSRDPDDVFLHVMGEGAMTIAEVHDTVARIRAGFRKAGVQKGDMVAADATVRLEVLLLSCAAWLHGASILRIDARAKPDKSLRLFRDLPIRMTFTSNPAAFAEGGLQGEIIALTEDDTPGPHPDFAEWLTGAPDPEEIDVTPAEVSPEDACVIAPTSGSTGHPKGVVLPHASIWDNADRGGRAAGLGPSEIYCASTDLISNLATYVSLTIPILFGGTIVIPRPEARNAPIALALDCAEAGVTVAMIVPAALRTILSAQTDLVESWVASLRTLFTATTAMGAPLAAQFREKSDAVILETLSARETGCFLATKTREVAVLANGGGYPAQALARVVDETGKVAAPGEIAEIFTVAPAIMTGYLREGVLTPSAYAHLDPRPPGYDLWYPTGDLGRYTAAGRIEVVGRDRDIIKAPDGQILMPIEIEDILHASDEILEACAFSVMHPDGYEVVAAAVIPTMYPAETDVETRLRKRISAELGPLRTPSGVLVLECFPRVGRSKVDKQALKELFLAEKIETPP